MDWQALLNVALVVAFFLVMLRCCGGMRGMSGMGSRGGGGGSEPRAPEEATMDKPTTYTCPMHPEVQQQKPGQCPKCGMNLIPADRTK